MAEKMSNVERAKQFLPFNALRGFYNLVKNKEKIIMEKKELSSDELEILSYKFVQLKKGKIVKIKYYEQDGYVTFEGMITNIDTIFKTITLVDTLISFDNIIDISADWIKEFSIE